MTTITELKIKLECLVQTLERNTDAAQVYIDVLREEIDALKDAEKMWPQRDDICYVLENTGSIWSNNFAKIANGSTSRTGDSTIKQGNIFTTREAAERERDRRALIVELRRRANGFVPTWTTDEIIKHYLLYERYSHKWEWSSTFGYDYCPASGYFAAPIDGLIEELGDRLNLLRSVP